MANGLHYKPTAYVEALKWQSLKGRLPTILVVL
jgi:hypothetical protein